MILFLILLISISLILNSVTLFFLVKGKQIVNPLKKDGESKESNKLSRKEIEEFVSILEENSETTMVSDKSTKKQIKKCFRADNLFLVIIDDKVSVFDDTHKRVLHKFNNDKLDMPKDTTFDLADLDGVLTAFLGIDDDDEDDDDE